jgi:hypothetical protein
MAYQGPVQQTGIGSTSNNRGLWQGVSRRVRGGTRGANWAQAKGTGQGRRGSENQ